VHFKRHRTSKNAPRGARLPCTCPRSRYGITLVTIWNSVRVALDKRSFHQPSCPQYQQSRASFALEMRAFLYSVLQSRVAITFSANLTDPNGELISWYLEHGANPWKFHWPSIVNCLHALALNLNTMEITSERRLELLVRLRPALSQLNKLCGPTSKDDC
jgi:nuclear transport factor 2 (NTF2) superfamily protein